MASKLVPMPPVDDPSPEQPLADHLHPPKQPTGHPNSPTQPADQPYPPPGYQPGYTPGQYPGVQAPVITQQPAAYQHTSNQTTVVVNQQVVQAERQNRHWSSGLCGCFDDCGSMCMGLLCPEVLLLDISSQMGEGCCLPCCCPHTALFGLRAKFRAEQNIQGSLMDDYLAIQFCPLCVMCQLARELKSNAQNR